MQDLLFPVLLLIAGLGLAVLEVFVPSAGVLGFLSVSAVIASVVIAFFNGGPSAGFPFLVLAAAGLPGAFALALYLLPRTSMGQRVILGPPTSDEVLPDDAERQRQLIGKIGVTQSVMLPSGRVKIEGQLYDALSEGLPIEAGQTVAVVNLRGGSLVVRPSKAAPTPKSEGSLLDRPFESFGVDPFQDEDESAGRA